MFMQTHQIAPFFGVFSVEHAHDAPYNVQTMRSPLLCLYMYNKQFLSHSYTPKLTMKKKNIYIYILLPFLPGNINP